jgi:hypothetical protein
VLLYGPEIQLSRWLATLRIFPRDNERVWRDIAADMAIAIEVASDTVNTIEWLAPADGLLIGTAGGEFLSARS